jgi:DNA-directed RNA polymerase sigma subunit (sigma70/sigma32)
LSLGASGVGDGDHGSPMTFSEIAARLAVSKQRCCQLARKAERRMREEIERNYRHILDFRT